MTPGSTASAALRFQSGQDIGGYRLVRLLGQGGFGLVFEAIHLRIGQRVALKIVDASVHHPEMLKRFVNEARILAQLRHPGIVAIQYCDELEDGTIFLAMEYLEGLSLRTYLRQQGDRLAVAQALVLAHQIAETMAHVHARSIIHRDLKPDNVIVLSEGGAAGGLRAKIIDFGIASAPHPGDAVDTDVRTAPGAILGTPRYLAPESCCGQGEVSDRTDVYALGIMIFEMLAGHPPFVAHSDVELLPLHLHAPPPLLREHVPAVPGSVSALVAEMLTKAAQDRPAMATVAARLAPRTSGGHSLLRWHTVLYLLWLGLALLVPSGLWIRHLQRQADEHLLDLLETAERSCAGLDWKLSQRPDTAAIRRESLQQLLLKLSALRDAKHPDWRVERVTARCQFRLGDLALLYESVSQAEEAYDAGSFIIHQVERLSGEPHLREEIDQLHATDLTKHGDLARQKGLQSVAKAAYAEASQIQQGLLGRHPDDPEYLRQVAISYDGQGDVLLEEGDVQGALSLYLRAQAALERRAPVAADPLYQRYVEMLVMLRLGDVERQQKSWGNAAGEYTRALALLRPVVAAQPASGWYRLLLGQLLQRSAETFRITGHRDDAHRCAQGALDIARSLSEGDPNNRRYALLRVDVLGTAGALAEDEGDRPAVQRAEQEAQDIRLHFAADAGNAMWRRELAEGHLHLLRLTASAGEARAHLEQAESLLYGFLREERWLKDQRVLHAWVVVRQKSLQMTSP